MRLKRAIVCTLIMFLMIGMIPVNVRAEEDTTRYSFGHFYYHSHNGYVSICGYLGRETEVEIPSVMSGRPVSEIESGSFIGCHTIETITVPDTVVMVYEDSFTGAASLKKIISHTVGVEIKADSGVTIDYVDERNQLPTEETTPSAPENSSGEATPSGPVNPSGETTSPEGTTPSNGSTGGNDGSEITTPSDPYPEEEAVSGIGEGAHEAFGIEWEEDLTEGSDIASDNAADDSSVEVAVDDEEGLPGEAYKETVENESNPTMIFLIADIIGIVIVTAAAGYAISTKNKKKES